MQSVPIIFLYVSTSDSRITQHFETKAKIKKRGGMIDISAGT